MSGAKIQCIGFGHLWTLTPLHILRSVLRQYQCIFIGSKISLYLLNLYFRAQNPFTKQQKKLRIKKKWSQAVQLKVSYFKSIIGKTLKSLVMNIDSES